jgi:hypothetical protein
VSGKNELAFGPAAVDGVGRADPEDVVEGAGEAEGPVVRGVGALPEAVVRAEAVVAGAWPPSHPATRPVLKQITPVVATRNRRVRRRLDTASSMGGTWTERKRPSA